jgi:hypothetical protein
MVRGMVGDIATKGVAHTRYRFFNRAGGRLGTVSEIRVPVACPICSDAQYLVIQNEAGRILRVTPLIPIERRGAPLGTADTAAFLNQFEGMSPGRKVYLGAGVDGITGATVTAHKYVQGVRELLRKPKVSPKRVRPRPGGTGK